MNTEFIDLPTLTRSVEVVPSSLNEDAGTVEVIASTGSTVRRSGWTSDFDERLVITPETVDLSRLNAGAPVLDTHSWEGGTEAIRGITVPGSARVENGNVIETLRVDRETASGADLWRKIKAGFVRFLSIGYDADFTRTRARDRKDGGTVDLLESTMLRIFETSFVPAGADPGAAIRSAPQGATRRYAVRSTEETAMDPKSEPTQTPAVTDDAAIRAAEKRAEQSAFERMALARSAAKIASVTDEETIAKIAHECRSPEQIKARFFDLAEEGQRGKLPSTPQVTGVRGGDQGDKLSSLINGAILGRALQGVDPKRIRQHNARAEAEGLEKIERPTDPEMARAGRRRLMELAETFLESRGISTRGMTPNDVAGHALAYRSGGGSLATTDDFSSALGNAANKMLLAGYAEVTSPWRDLIGMRMDKPDFKQFSLYRRSAAPDLEYVNEHGEVKRASYNTPTALTGQLRTAGIEVGFTRQMLINDDLGMFTEQSLGLGDAAMRFEDDFVITTLLYGNPTLADGTALFHSTRGNLSTDVGAPDLAAVTVVAGLFAQMTETIKKAGNNAGTTTRKISQDVGGFIAAFTEAVAINQILRPENYVPTTAGNALPDFLRGLTAYREARLAVETSSPDVWFGFSANRRAIAYGYLAGETGPRLTQFQASNTDGVVYQLIHDWYGAVADPYALVRVPKS